MKKQYLLFIFFFLVGALLCFFLSRPGEDEFRVYVQNFDEKSDVYSIHLEYPKFPDLPNSFNQKIKRTLFDEMESFRTLSEENTVVREKTAQSVKKLSYDLSLVSGWSASQINKNTVSVVVHTYSYTGGAHGSQKVYTFTMDAKNKKEVTLDTLFGNPKSYLDKISQFALNDLKNQLRASSGFEPNIDMLRDGTSPKAENFSKFTVDATNTATFYFEEYQVAPYAAGEQKVIMPISYIKNEESPFLP